MRQKNMPRDNKTKFVILGLLCHEPLSGYDVKKWIERAIHNFWNASFGQIYPALKELEQEGMVVKRTEKSETRPDKNIYCITDAGREELKIWLGQSPAKELIKYEIVLKLFFGNHISSEKNIEHIKDFQKRYNENLILFEEFEKSLKTVLDDDNDHIYRLLTVSFGQYLSKAMVEWSNEAIEILEKLDSKGS